MNRKFILSLAVTAFFITGCSLQQSTPKEPPKQLVSVDLDIFAARGFLGGSDYEHYTLKDGLLWRECGSLPLRKTSTDTNAMLKTLQVRQKRLESLKPEEQAPIVSALEQVKAELTKTALKEFPAPQSVKSMSDGGLFEMKSGSLHLATTVDVVGDGKPKASEKVRNLFEAVRGVGPVICDSKTFFGIGKK